MKLRDIIHEIKLIHNQIDLEEEPDQNDPDDPNERKSYIFKLKGGEAYYTVTFNFPDHNDGLVLEEGYKVYVLLRYLKEHKISYKTVSFDDAGMGNYTGVCIEKAYFKFP